MATPKHPVRHVVHLIRTALQRQALLPAGTRVLIAISGGQDSLTLAESLSLLNKPSLWPSLALAHCNHSWPGDDRIAAHVASYAASRHLPLHTLHASPPPRETEAAAREWRYAALENLALEEGFHAVVTGHTRTDLAETVLAALAGGAGPDGLGSLSWSRALSRDGPVRLVRPMLAVSRLDTEAFCRARPLHVWEDAYNTEMRFKRNRVRGSVMPVLREMLNTEVEEALARTGHLVRAEGIEVEKLARVAYASVVVVERDGAWVCRRGLRAVGVAVQRRVVRRVLKEVAGARHEGKTFAQVEAVLALMDGAVGAQAASLAGAGVAAVKDGDRIWVGRGAVEGERALSEG